MTAPNGPKLEGIKPDHSHGKYDTASQYRTGPTDTLNQAIARFGPENLVMRKNHTRKAGQALVIEEAETGLTVWSSTDKVGHDTVMKLLKRLGTSHKYK